jgi:peptidoglycan/LPS O-acetylase OafA/YrhL
MAMVLSSSKYGSKRQFYASRFLRVFLPYWIVLVATCAWSVLSGVLFNQWLVLKPFLSHPMAHNGAAGLIFASLTNFTLFGQDWVMFLAHDHGGHLGITEYYRTNASPLYQYLLVPQCWSVGLELVFYALAPFLNRLKSAMLILLAISSYAARGFAYWHFHAYHDPWDYRFFPFELSQFLFGMLGYRLYAKLPPISPAAAVTGIWRYLIGAAIVLAALYAHLKASLLVFKITGYHIGILGTFPIWALIIPVLFYFFGANKYDRYVGELSYPLYLLHYIVVESFVALLPGTVASGWIGRFSAIVSLVLSVLFYEFFIKKLDRKRHSLASRQSLQPVVQTHNPEVEKRREKAV